MEVKRICSMLELYEILLIVIAISSALLVGYVCGVSNMICKKKNGE